MIVLGIDPGSRYTGYGVVRTDDREVSYVASGRIDATTEERLEDRLPIIYDGVEYVLDEFEPDEVAIESIFTAHNAKSTIKLGHARGVAVLALRNFEVPVYDYPPAKMKKTVADHGRATKEEIQRMVKWHLDLEGSLAEDAADALSAAICHSRMASIPAALNRPAERGSGPA